MAGVEIPHILVSTGFGWVRTGHHGLGTCEIKGRRRWESGDNVGTNLSVAPKQPQYRAELEKNVRRITLQEYREKKGKAEVASSKGR